MTPTYTVAIIGGGITGLTTAYYLQKAVREQNLPIRYVLIEAEDRLGGTIITDYTNDFVIELGPDSFLARKTSIIRLAEEVGLKDDLVRNHTGQAFILTNGQLHPMPGGSIMGIPTKVAPFVTTSLFSLPGKMRAACDLFLPRAQSNGSDQSLGKFFRRRLGNEVVENLIEPLLSGVYSGDIDDLSLMSTFPQFYQVEQKYRSLILGMRSTTPKQPKSAGDKKSSSAFMTFKSGLQSLVESIEARLDPNCIRTGTSVSRVARAESGYTLHLADGTQLNADSVVLSSSLHPTRKMLAEYDFSHLLSEIPTSSVATAALAFPLEAIQQDVNGTGFIVSRNENFTITACTWTHKKWPHTAPAGKALLRCFVGRPWDDSPVHLPDEELIAVIMNDLNKIMKIDQKPEFYRISRWKQVRPQYVVGHKARIDQFVHELGENMPGMFVAGAPYYGAGLPDCIDQGEAAVSEVIKFLHTPSAISL